MIKDKYYVGFTGDDMAVRLKKHNTNHKGFTGGIGDWTLVHEEKYISKEKAMAREKEVKRWKSRKLIVALIAKHSSDDSEHSDL